MTTELYQAIMTAYESPDNQTVINKAYLIFLKENFIIPIENGTENEPIVLYINDNGKTFLPIFHDKIALDKWATPIKNNIQLLTVSAIDLLKSVGDNVYVCLDIGATHFKVFDPLEIRKLKNMIQKIFK